MGPGFCLVGRGARGSGAHDRRRLAKSRTAGEAELKVEATRQARAKLHTQLSELRRRDAAVIAGMRREYDGGYQQRQAAWNDEERVQRAQSIAELEYAAERRALQWASAGEIQQMARPILLRAG